MVYLVVHAFSRRNAGDGLLTDLTMQRLARAGIQPEQCVVAALDPESFPDLPNVYGVPSEPWGRLSWRAVGAGAHLLAAGVTVLSGNRIAAGGLAQLARSASGIVGLGGAYLRAGGVVEAGGCLLNHVPQLALAGASPAPSVYLPQSIGPLPGPVGAGVRRLLRHIDTVYARDDQTVAELGRPDNVVAMPDLAVLELAERLGEPASVASGDTTILVPRDLGSERYDHAQRQLAAIVPDPRWAVQAASVGSRNDAEHIRRLGGTDPVPLRDLLSTTEGGVVISVRLHGALQALLAGWPAIHLSYQRKGWGAYRDLGLAEYVHDARDFDPALVARQAETVRADPQAFFARLHEVAPRLQTLSAALDRGLRSTLNRT